MPPENGAEVNGAFTPTYTFMRHLGTGNSFTFYKLTTSNVNVVAVYLGSILLEYEENMAAARSLYLVFGLMVVTDETFDLGV